MNTLRDIFTGPTSRRPHRILGAVALLITWSFFGTVNNVMHVGAYLTALLWLGGIDWALCLWLYARHRNARISAAASKTESENTPADKNDLGRAA